MFLQDLATWVNETPTNRALTDLYDTNNGEYVTPRMHVRAITNIRPATLKTSSLLGQLWVVRLHHCSSPSEVDTFASCPFIFTYSFIMAGLRTLVWQAESGGRSFGLGLGTHNTPITL